MPWVNEALEEAQNPLLQMCTKLQALESQNALLEAQKGKGHRGKKVGNLSNKELSVTLKEEAIHTHGHKYSATHCLWINTEIFPLCKNPEINLVAAECWVSPLAIEDGMKTELFKYIPMEDQTLMAHKDFGEAFSHGIQSLRSEMVSDIKSMASAVFRLPADFFPCSCNRFEELRCWQLLLSPTGKYMVVQMPQDQNSVFKFFNNSLFPASSKDNVTVQVEADDWELAYQNAFKAGVELPAVITTQSASAPFPPHEPAPSPSHPVTPLAVAPSISAALEDLTLDNELVPPPPGPSEAAGEHELGEATGAKGKVRGKVKCKGKATITVDEVGLDVESSSAISNARRTRHGRGQA
ncbi:hypothetical protein PISMIDRAFT_14162 [Pisolithus microcarpus 441]|uniref:Uncharacterized protein n=1 Tax=Pisolithus microcarpus 441 TaxID=765257 RepID=A0A0C9Y1W0_9AGAM|nr:hypothetical protein BKA83DRAFT_14162 [Pisolithus microcarpus]KIK18725.1 hypothetical protein PISMIDRAFT_14162 [Pisolithus microcarpus 441]